MVGVGAANLEAAFKMLPQDSNIVQPRANPVYEEAFKRYRLMYKFSKQFVDILTRPLALPNLGLLYWAEWHNY